MPVRSKRRSLRGIALLSVGLLVVVVAGCVRPRAWDTNRQLLCGSSKPFDRAALTAATEPLDSTDPAVVAARNSLSSDFLRQEPREPLRVAWRTADQVLFLVGDTPGHDPLEGSPYITGGSIEVTNTGSGWWQSNIDHRCYARTIVPNKGVGVFALDPAYPLPTADSTSLHVLVRHGACDRINERQIVFDKIDGALVVTVTWPPESLAPPGTVCVAILLQTAIEIPLDEPLGGRLPLDGAHYPAPFPIVFFP